MVGLIWGDQVRSTPVLLYVFHNNNLADDLCLTPHSNAINCKSNLVVAQQFF